ncbi:MAG: DUF2189 domain-containing protein [Paludibacterium sp.]|uniref:DUF2189 domain-containing protein n=1 Tax=Paludibacterium sp. TaxID=1917523 RepID=UPI0025FFD7CD|nr:DUF2189 domain-containing protein [Paludibacterium sp.]MBV8048918.1 DUF2189 domain-containing protein [Paludibacterium sp.]MBV8649277.1 DUF2189 domain-containing protein [Paludibacterium sp.]
MDLIHDTVTEHIVIRQAAPSRIRHWLRQAVEDIRRAPADTLFYGALFVLMGYVLLYYFTMAPAYVLALSTAFLLAGPFLAIGLYDLARQREGVKRHERVSLRRSMVAWRGNVQAFTLYAALLAVMAFTWFRVSLLVFALFYDYAALPSLDDIVARLLDPQNIVFLLVYFAAGFLFALVTFVASVVSVPMMLDKEVDTVTAMLTSFMVVQRNLKTMAWWAAIIVLLTGVGLLTYFVGLLFVMPLVGLATWHAYRDMVAFEH